MYQRDQSGHTPQISNYLDNLGDGEAEFELDIEVGHGPGVKDICTEEGTAKQRR